MPVSVKKYVLQSIMALLTCLQTYHLTVNYKWWSKKAITAQCKTNKTKIAHFYFVYKSQSKVAPPSVRTTLWNTLKISSPRRKSSSPHPKLLKPYCNNNDSVRILSLMRKTKISLEKPCLDKQIMIPMFNWSLKNV